MRKIRIAIVGVGNCASSLVQGINFYGGSSADGSAIGLMHREIGFYRPSDIEVVAAFDIDRRKVRLDVSKAIFSPPNCTKAFCEKIKLTCAIAQMGATIVHRMMVDLFRKRGVKLVRTYQLNTGGNTDFLNMLNRTRLASKKTSKTEAVQSVIGERLADENIHIGPSDYVPWQLDNKIAFIRVEGRLFGDVPMEIDLKLSVEDSPNSAGVAIDAIRCCKLALDRGIGGVLHSASAYFSKHPPVQMTDDEAYRCVEQFIRGERES